MPFVTVDGLEFHVQRLGSSRADAAGGDASPVVMVHGLFTGNVASWFFTSAPALARLGPVLLYDLRGHGRTERPPSGYSSEVQATDLAALTAELPPFTLVAHSFGAVVAMKYALTNPGRVNALALIEPPIMTDDGDAWWQHVEGANPAGDHGTFDARDWLETLGGDAEATSGSHTRLLETVRALAEDTTLLSELRAERAVTDEDLAALPAPLLFVLGRRSACIDIAPRVRRVRPDAGITLFDCGHAVHLEARNELTEVLEKFVQSCRSAGEHLPSVAPSRPASADADGDDADNGDDHDEAVAYG